MNFRSLIFKLCLVAIIAGAFIALQPVQTADACLPCTCPYANPPVNCYGPYGFFIVRHGENNFDIQIMNLVTVGDQVKGVEAIYLTDRQLDRFETDPEQHQLIAKKGFIEVYKTSWGDYQVNVGPTQEGVVYTLIIDEVTGDKVDEGGFRVQAQQ